jgi:hypothetical protein
MEFSKTLVRASIMGVLFTEPKDAAAKKAGELSATAKTMLIETYIREYWNRSQDITTSAMEKGTLAEPSMIELLSWVDKIPYEKNEVRATNEYATGHADIVCEDEIIDVKSSWSPFTFLPKLTEPISKMYNIQIQTYMWLYNKPKGRLCYGLVDTPDFVLQNELKKLLWNMDVISEESPAYKIASAELIRNMTYEDLPPQERIISIKIDRDEEIIQQMPEKVEKARKFLAEFHEKHMNLYPKSI